VAGANIGGRVVVLIFLILIIIGGGLLWFDYLNVIDAKDVIGPVVDFLRPLPLIGRLMPSGLGRTQSLSSDGDILNLDAERLAVRMEALELRNMEMDKQEQDMQSRMGQIEQMAQELEERQKALDEREKSLNAVLSDAEIKDRNVEQIAINLTSMPPERAVGILAAMDDQNIIDVLRKTDELAQASGSQSIVPYWLSLMDSQRAAEISRKMVSRPSSLN